MTTDPADLQGRTFLVVAVPTPVDHNNVPDLSAVERATATVGRALSRGAVVSPAVVSTTTWARSSPRSS